MSANIGWADSLILMVMALVVFGPRRLPELGRQLGKLMYEFRKASNDFKFQMEEELRAADEADRRRKEEAERQRQLAANPPAQIEASTTPTETPAATPEPAGTDYRDPYAYGYSELTEEQIRIQPPSTGEPVAADRPTASAAEPEPARESTSETAPESAEQESADDTAPQDADKTIHSAAQNG